MREFIRENYYYLNEGVIILAALIGLLTFNKYKKTEVRYFIYFLIYVVFIELIGWYPSIAFNYDSFSWITDLTKGTIFEENFLWYGVFWHFGSAVFVLFYFKSIIDNYIYKKLLLLFGYLYIAFSVVYFIFNYETYFIGELKLINFLGVFIIVTSTVLYMTETLMSEKIVTFYKSINFYIAIVFFVFFLIKTPISFFQVYYSTADWNFVFLRYEIVLFCNLFMYLTFAFALIWCKPEKGVLINRVS